MLNPESRVRPNEVPLKNLVEEFWLIVAVAEQKNESGVYNPFGKSLACDDFSLWIASEFVINFDLND